MSSARSEIARRPGSASRAAAALLLLLALAPGRAGVTAGEATARGRKADITWVEPDGRRVTVHARHIRYGYYRRVYLSVPRDGRNFKEEARYDRGIPLGNRLTRFSRMDKAVFEREEAGGNGRPRLSITITRPNGRVVTGTGDDLVGTDHPLSPWLEFTVDGVTKRIDLHPRATAETIAAHPRLELIQIVL